MRETGHEQDFNDPSLFIRNGSLVLLLFAGLELISRLGGLDTWRMN